jgi:hypothetical protein
VLQLIYFLFCGEAATAAKRPPLEETGEAEVSLAAAARKNSGVTQYLTTVLLTGPLLDENASENQILKWRTPPLPGEKFTQIGGRQNRQ